MSQVKIGEFVFETRTFHGYGKEYELRELSVEENDECSDAAKDENGVTNGRIMMRMMIVKAVINPPLEIDDLAKLPQRLYLRLCDVVNEMSDPRSLPEPEEDEPGKDSSRSTSSGARSRGSSESSPTA